MCTKICSRCKKSKPFKDFCKNKNNKDGLGCQCKQCNIDYRKENTERTKKYYLKNKEKHNKRCNKYYQENKEQCKKLAKQYRKANSKQNREQNNKRNRKYRQEHKEQFKIYRKINKEKINKQCRKRYQGNKAAISNRHKLYFKNNKEKIYKRTNARRKTDVNYQLRCNLSKRTWEALKNNKKSDKTIALIGCSVNQLKQHLESQFTKDMTWDNYGMYGWHIDHIKPCAKFDLSKPEEQRKCFHYTNLQPLWAKDNLSKGAKYKKNTPIRLSNIIWVSFI